MNKMNIEKLVQWYYANGGKQNSFLKVIQEPFLPLSVEIEYDRLLVGYWFKENGDLIPDTVVSCDLKTMASTVWLGLGGPYYDDVLIDEFMEQVHERLAQSDWEIQPTEPQAAVSHGIIA